MKKIILFLVCLHVLSYSYGQDTFSGLRYAYSSWRINKPLLEKYTAEYQAKVEECKALKIANEAEIERLKAQREKVLQELLAGSFCDQCSRSKSEIEAAEHITFAEHIKNVRGTMIAAPPAVVKKRMDEFDDKIRTLSSAITSCDGDLFLLKGKVNTYTIYVESNVKTATASIAALNTQLSQDLAAIIQKKNTTAADINGQVKAANIKLNALSIIEASLQQSTNMYKAAKDKLDDEYKAASNKINSGLGNLNGRLTASSQDSAKTKIEVEIAALNKETVQNQTAYQHATQTLNDNYNAEQGKLLQDSNNIINILNDVVNSLNTPKNDLNDLSRKAIAVKSNYDNNITFINRVISEMKLNITFVVRINADSNQVLNKVLSNKISTDSAAAATANINDAVSNCQLLINTIENVKNSIATR